MYTVTIPVMIREGFDARGTLEELKRAKADRVLLALPRSMRATENGYRIDADAFMDRIFAEPLRDSANYARSATREIGEGGIVILGNNCRTYVGGNQRSGELIISGGTMRTGTGCGIYLGHNGYSVGTLRFNSGLLEISTPFRKSDVRDQSLVYWKGGTLKIGANFSSDAILTGDYEGIYVESADLNSNGRLDIGDVTTIIDMLLNGE